MVKRKRCVQIQFDRADIVRDVRSRLPLAKNACRPNSEQIELKSFQLLCFVSLLSSTATKDLPSVVGWTPVSRTILVAVSVLPYRRWFASLSGSTVAPPRDTPANSPSAFP